MRGEQIIKKRKTVFCAILLVTLLVLAYFFPYSGDDWAWGSSIGIDRLNSHFAGYNGRYLGNLVVMVLTRSEILKTLCIAGCLFGIITLTYKYTNTKNITLLFLSSMLILGLPKLVLRQAVVWTAGFSNYAVSILLVLIYMYIIRNIFNKEKPNYSKYIVIPMFLIGIATTLFVEHVTIYSVILAIFIIIYTYIKFKKVYPVHIGYLIGTIVGTVLMFSNTAYTSIADHQDTYRSVPKMGISSLMQSVIGSYFDVIYKELIFNNIVLNVVITILSIVVLYKYNKGNSRIKSILGNLIGFIIVTYSIYGIIKGINPTWNILLRFTKYFEGLYSAVYFIAIVLLVILFIKDSGKKANMLFLLGSIAFLTAPLFIVKPIGSRCFFDTYVIFMVLVNELADYVMKDIKEIAITKLVNKIIITVCILFAVYLLSIYSYIAKVNHERLDYVKSQVAQNKQEIILTELPYESYLWVATPLEHDLWEDRFKLFYGVPKDTIITTVSLKEWNDKYSK